MKDRKAKQILSGTGYQWEGDGKQRVKEGKYGQRTLYMCMKIEP
jgi:hypothetical protein